MKKLFVLAALLAVVVAANDMGTSNTGIHNTVISMSTTNAGAGIKTLAANDDISKGIVSGVQDSSDPRVATGTAGDIGIKTLAVNDDKDMELRDQTSPYFAEITPRVADDSTERFA